MAIVQGLGCNNVKYRNRLYRASIICGEVVAEELGRPGSEIPASSFPKKIQTELRQCAQAPRIRSRLS